MKLYICPNHVTKQHIQSARYCIEQLERDEQISCYMSAEVSWQVFGNGERSGQNPVDCDMLVSVGGDGAVLRAACLAVEIGKPLMGINSGRVGYLCAYSLAELPEIDERALFQLEATKRSLLQFNMDGQMGFALNDVVITKSEFGAPIELSAEVSGQTLGIWRGDGLIISTPTGSSAYNRSAGGPLVMADASCFVVTPICSHTCPSAPIVINDKHAVKIRIRDRSGKAHIYADGVRQNDVCGELLITRFEKELMLLNRKHSGRFSHACLILR